MPAKHADLHKMLTGKLKAEVTEGSSHTKYKIVEDGRVVASTILSRNHQEVSDNLLSQIAGRQLFVSNKQMRLLLDCPMTREEYIAHQSRKNR